jgi:FtsP/CotA-like multicopper oxidase with cupredoxin domain
MSIKGQLFLRSILLSMMFLSLESGLVSAAVDPALAEKAARVHAQMEQRVTTAEKAAAAAALKALRENVYEAKQMAAAAAATSTSGGVRKASVAGLGTVYQAIPTGPVNADGTPAVPDYNTTANWANSPPLAKFVDSLPGLGAAKANNLGQYISVAVPDTTTYPGSDYYEIDLVEYSEQLHSDLPATGTKLRGYVQVNPGTAIKAGSLPSQGLCGADSHPCTAADTSVTPDPVHYLGPAIVAERDRPVRIKFTNRLPNGTDGNLFIPVDTTVMGAGMGPKDMNGADCDPGMADAMCAEYTQNRATIHLHGGRTPWISDGTPHQWITPAGEDTPYPKGVSVVNVPDMPDPGDGSMTFFYSNQQSARLMFYHDHAFGITRLNVYAGEAAAYVITDPYEQDLVNRGLIPPEQIPLVIQDKTFVDASEIRKYDPLWNWGSGAVDAAGVRAPIEGDLWLPHVYMPAQNPFNPDFSGVNPFGRWMYGPWFYPVTDVAHPPIANPYYDPDCSSPDPAVYAQCQTPGQPPLIPATPHPSMGMEAFMDTAVVNGTVFPRLEVDARAYRFRILNAAGDRMLNLSLYKADQTQVSPDPRLDPLNPAYRPGASNLTEVKSVPAVVTPGWPELWPVDGREGGVPDPATRGPSFLQIGTEGGFLPKPVVIEPQPIGYYTDPTAFWVGNVKDHALALGPAERADVIVDFSGLEGQTLLLYNDAPAAWPAGVANYDYFTGAPDRRDTGGYGAGGTFNAVTGVWEGGHGTEVGYGPNTRTVMQIVVRSTPADLPYTFDQANLEAEFVPTNPATPSLFAKAQEPIIVGQTAYKEIYPNSYFPPNWPWSGIAKIQDNDLSFVTLAGKPVVVPMEPKGIHDEMGASFDKEYGRMSGNLGMQIPNPTTLTANLILYGFSDVPTEYIDNSTGVTVAVNPDRTLADGTQIWKISHNGVDTHPIHFHIFDVQLINRVGWDGQIALPDPNEYGWKDTIRISPLEDTIVAVRPRAPELPFGVAESVRPLNPTIPLGSEMGFNSIDPATGQAYGRNSPYAGGVTNRNFNFGWEYVWHCHILSHEEMDMMRPIVLNVETTPSSAPALSLVYNVSQVNLTWTDPTPVNYVTASGFGNSSSEIGFRVERCAGASCTNFAPYGTALANQTTFVDTAIAAGTDYRYRVIAYNAAGDSPVSNAVSTKLTVMLTPTVSSPQMTGTVIAFTAAASGDVPGPYEYSFFWRPSGTSTYTLGRTWTTTPTWTWSTVALGLPAGSYVIRVNVRHVGSSVAFEANNLIGYNLITLTAPATGATLTPAVVSPQPKGTAITFTAAATGGDAGPYEYSFWWRPSTTTTYTLGRTWTTTPSWTWNTAALGLPAGSYVIRVNVRHVGSSVAFETNNLIGYNLITVIAPATGATLTPAVVSPQPKGSAITFTSAATGGDVGPYEYSFWWRPSGSTTYTLGRTWGTTPTWTWNTLGLPIGSYVVRVNARHVGTTVPFEAFNALTFGLN